MSAYSYVHWIGLKKTDTPKTTFEFQFLHEFTPSLTILNKVCLPSSTRPCWIQLS